VGYEVNWQQAVRQVDSLNTIATLVYHLHYYVRALTPVLQGKVLAARDQDSFAHPPIRSQEDWEALLAQVWQEVETFAGLIERLPEEKLWEDFADPKYGNWYRNLQGVVEHHHYHLGQIVMLKKMLR
jgi:hypothetical protein